MTIDLATIKTRHRNAAYRYAYALSMDSRYQGQDWSAIAGEVRAHWEKEYEKIGAWEDFETNVRRAWHEFKEADDPYQVYLKNYQDHHRTYYGGSSDNDTGRRTAYRVGYDLGTDQQHRLRKWADVEQDARKRWEEKHDDQGLWEDVKEAVRYAWNSLTGQDDDYEDARDDFQKHYDTTYAPHGRPYLNYDPAYRYGYNLWLDDRFAGRIWDDIEPEARQYWETEYRHTHDWDDYREAVRYGYDVMQLRMGV